MYKIVYTKQAIKDIALLQSAKLDQKAQSIITALEIDPFASPPPFEKLVGDMNGAYSRRINIKHRLVYEIDITKQAG